MIYTITPYAYRKIRETIKASEECVRKTDILLKDRSLANVLKEPDRVKIRLTIIKS